MEETSKTLAHGGDASAKAPPAVEEDIVAWLSMDEDTVDELMKCLDAAAAETEEAAAARVKFIENPYSSPVIFQSSSAYVTINGNEESCGSSFSDSESSVMASVDVSGMVNVIGGLSWGNEGGSWGTREGGVRGEEGMVMDGCDWAWGDDCLARFLGEDLFDHCNSEQT